MLDHVVTSARRSRQTWLRWRRHIYRFLLERLSASGCLSIAVLESAGAAWPSSSLPCSASLSKCPRQRAGLSPSRKRRALAASSICSIWPLISQQSRVLVTQMGCNAAKHMLGADDIGRQLAHSREGVELQFARPAFPPLLRPAAAVCLLVFASEIFERRATCSGLAFGFALRLPLPHRGLPVGRFRKRGACVDRRPTAGLG